MKDRFVNGKKKKVRFTDRGFSMKKFIITKKIAKHGSQAIVVIPRLLEKDLKPGTVVEMTFNVIREAEE